MKQFTDENTEGYTAEQLDEMNRKFSSDWENWSEENPEHDEDTAAQFKLDLAAQILHDMDEK